MWYRFLYLLCSVSVNIYYRIVDRSLPSIIVSLISIQHELCQFSLIANPAVGWAGLTTEADTRMPTPDRKWARHITRFTVTRVFAEARTCLVPTLPGTFFLVNRI